MVNLTKEKKKFFFLGLINNQGPPKIEKTN